MRSLASNYAARSSHSCLRGHRVDGIKTDLAAFTSECLVASVPSCDDVTVINASAVYAFACYASAPVNRYQNKCYPICGDGTWPKASQSLIGHTVHDNVKTAAARAALSIPDIGAVKLIVDDRACCTVRCELDLVDGILGNPCKIGAVQI